MYSLCKQQAYNAKPGNRSFLVHSGPRKGTGEHVDADDVVRAFELEKGRFVPMEPDDLDRLDVELTHSVDICDFVSLDEIDPIYFRCPSRARKSRGWST